MKKLLVVFTTLLAIGMLSGCGKGAETDPNGTGTETQSQEGGIPAITPGEVEVDKYVTIEEYKGLEVSIEPKVEFSQEEIEQFAFSVYRNGVTAEAGGIKDRAAETGDTVNIDYSGKKDGVAFEGGTAAGQSLALGSGQFIDGFEAGLVGIMPGETLDLELTFPETYGNAELAGQAVVFTVTVNYIYPADPSQMVDEVVVNMGQADYKTVKEFIDFCAEYVEYMSKRNYENARRYAVLDALVTASVVSEVPEGLVQYYANSIYESLSLVAAQNMTDVDTYCNYYYGMGAQEYVDLSALDAATQRMVAQVVANKENLNVSDAEYETSLQEFAEENKTTVEEIRNSQDDEMMKEYFLFEKVVDFLIQNGKVTES